MSGPKKVKNWWVILRRWEKILLKRIIRRWENILLKRIIRRFEDFSFRMFWNSRKLLFSKTFYYGIFEDFSFRMFWNIPRLLFFFSERSYRQNNTTFPNNHEKQAERCIKIHTLVYRRIRWISQRASSNNSCRWLEGSFLTSCFILSLSLSLCEFCFDLQRSAIKNGRYLGLF